MNKRVKDIARLLFLYKAKKRCVNICLTVGPRSQHLHTRHVRLNNALHTDSPSNLQCFSKYAINSNAALR